VKALVAREPARALIVAAATFAELATLPAGAGVLAVIPTPVPRASAFGDFCALLDDVQDPGNVGSMLRSAAAAGVDQVMLSKHCAFAWSPKVLRAAQGAHFLVDIHEDIDLPAWAAAYVAAGGQVVATSVDNATSLYDSTLTGRIAFAFGNEGAGLSAALAAQASLCVSIPMPGAMESLNAAAAAAICLFEAVRQRRGT
jgi:TrmH family RNA methyltransferase